MMHYYKYTHCGTECALAYKLDDGAEIRCHNCTKVFKPEKEMAKPIAIKKETHDELVTLVREYLGIIKDLYMEHHNLVITLTSAVNFNAQIHEKSVDSGYLLERIKKSTEDIQRIIERL